MNYIERGHNSITLMSLDTKLGNERTVFIHGEINDNAASEFFKQIMVLNRESAEEPITVCINSPGGEIKAGLLMYDVIQGSIAPIRLICTGRAYSMAAILLASGNPDHGRYILPNSDVMIHEPLIQGGFGGKTSSIKSISDSMIEIRAKLNGILARHTGHTLEEIDEATAYDHYFTAAEAVDFGICDKVVDFTYMI